MYMHTMSVHMHIKQHSGGPDPCANACIVCPHAFINAQGFTLVFKTYARFSYVGTARMGVEDHGEIFTPSPSQWLIQTVDFWIRLCHSPRYSYGSAIRDQCKLKYHQIEHPACIQREAQSHSEHQSFLCSYTSITTPHALIHQYQHGEPTSTKCAKTAWYMRMYMEIGIQYFKRKCPESICRGKKLRSV